jgi:hypothetical protein
MVRMLFGLESLFSLWMLVDAVQRGAARYWYPIIFLPFGQLAYFFSVKIHDPEFAALLRLFHGLTRAELTLDELRFEPARRRVSSTSWRWRKACSTQANTKLQRDSSRQFCPLTTKRRMHCSASPCASSNSKVTGPPARSAFSAQARLYGREESAGDAVAARGLRATCAGAASDHQPSRA